MDGMFSSVSKSGDSDVASADNEEDNAAEMFHVQSGWLAVRCPSHDNRAD
jgi:hypothetical protein